MPCYATHLSCCVYAGNCFEVKVEADSTEPDDKPRPHVCVVCDKRFTRKEGLSVHSKLHTGQNVYSCPQCGKTFSIRHNLKTHLYIHSNKYQCQECGKCFRSSQVLTEHRRRHSGEKPYECTVCSKRFARSCDLLVHSRIHSGEKPYKCLVCGKAFGRSDHLNRHMRIHVGDPLNFQSSIGMYAHTIIPSH